MDNAVALVQAYLRLNGYFTVTEQPVIGVGRDRQYRTATDLDVLAVRFPGAGRLVAVGGRRGNEEHMVLDDALLVGSDHLDMLVGEVKEGRAVLNDAAMDLNVLRTVLVTFGCCPREDAARIAETLLRDGHVVLPDGHRIRTAIFASLTADADTSRHLVISLGHIVKFLRSYIDAHREVMRHAESKDSALGFLMMLEKAERADR